MWNINSNECLKYCISQTGSKCLILSKNNSLIICAGLDDVIRIWNIHTGYFLQSLLGHQGLISFEMINDGQHFASTDELGIIKIWSLDDFKCVSTLKNNSKKIDSLKSIDNNEIIACSIDGQIKLWTMRHDQCVNSFKTKEFICSRLF